MKSRNQHIYNSSQNVLETLAEEYKSIGRYVKLEPGHLIVMALPPKKEVKKKVAGKGTKRRESYGRP